jgi:hypothetical protein
VVTGILSHAERADLGGARRLGAIGRVLPFVQRSHVRVVRRIEAFDV